jgi:hypothetical protein
MIVFKAVYTFSETGEWQTYLVASHYMLIERSAFAMSIPDFVYINSTYQWRYLLTLHTKTCISQCGSFGSESHQLS